MLASASVKSLQSAFWKAKLKEVCHVAPTILLQQQSLELFGRFAVIDEVYPKHICP